MCWARMNGLLLHSPLARLAKVVFIIGYDKPDCLALYASIVAFVGSEMLTILSSIIVSAIAMCLPLFVCLEQEDATKCDMSADCNAIFCYRSKSIEII